MKLAIKNLIVTGAVVSATLLSLVAVNTKPVTAQGLNTVDNQSISTESYNNCHKHDSEEDKGSQQSSSTTKKE